MLESLQNPLLPGVQWRTKLSVLYLPEIRAACTEAITIFVGEGPVVDQIGWGFFKDINSGLKYSNDLRLQASWRNFCSQ